MKSFVSYKSSKEQKWNIARTYKEKGKSGKSTDRPELQALFSDIKDGKVNTVICTKIDRISRSLLDFYKMVALFEKYNVEFVSLDENFDTITPMGRAALKITLVFAELEREQTSKRTKDKMAWRAEQGLWNGGQVLGYDLIDKKLIPNKREAKLVKTMYEKYIELGSIIQVANWLNKNGYRTKSFISNRSKNKRGGKKFNNTHVSQKLQSRVYIGDVELKGKAFKGQHEAIIDNNLWHHVNSLISQHAPTRKNPKRKTQHTFILQGLLRCGNCGSYLTTKYATSSTGKRHFYYQCTQNSHNGKEGCEMKYVPADKLEEIVLNKIKSLSVDKSLLDDISLKANESMDDELQELVDRRKDHENKLIAIKDKISNLIDAIASKTVKEHKSLDERMDTLEEQRTQLERTIQAVTFQIDERKRKVFNAEVMLKSLEAFSKIYDKATSIELKELLPYFVDHIVFSPQRIKIALFDQPTDKGLFHVNHSDDGAPELCKWLPVISSGGNFSYHFVFQKVTRISKRKMARQNRQNSYVNPVTLAREYQQIMQEEGLTQSQLAAKLGVSRVRVNQYIALLKLPEERQAEILKYSKKRIITERELRRKSIRKKT